MENRTPINPYSNLWVSYFNEKWSISEASPEEFIALRELLPKVCYLNCDALYFKWSAAEFTPATVDLGDTAEFARWLIASERWPKYLKPTPYCYLPRHELHSEVAYTEITRSLDPPDLDALTAVWHKIAAICTLEDTTLVRETLLDHAYRGTAPEELAWVSRRIARAHKVGCLTSELPLQDPGSVLVKRKKSEPAVENKSDTAARCVGVVSPWPAPDPASVVNLPAPSPVAPSNF